MKSINKKYVENKMLLNDMLPESGIGNKKLNNINNNNLVSFFNNRNNPIRISSLIYGKNNFDSITNKFSEITSPKITRIIHN